MVVGASEITCAVAQVVFVATIVKLDANRGQHANVHVNMEFACKIELVNVMMGSMADFVMLVSMFLIYTKINNNIIFRDIQKASADIQIISESIQIYFMCPKQS